VVNDRRAAGKRVYLVVLKTARSDGLTGLFGGLIKPRASNGSRNGLEQALATIKQMAEAGR
jgi:hypothetical protein